MSVNMPLLGVCVLTSQAAWYRVTVPHVLLFLSLLHLIHTCYVYPPDVVDPCQEKTCSFGAQCVPSLDGLTARCQCPERCDSYGDSLGSTPVCGSDGMDYANQCEMRRTACSTMREIRAKYMGKCDPCDGYECPTAQVCQLDDNRKPVCRCNSLCTHAFAPVCSSNGRTYSNECMLRVEACKQRREIRIIFRGPCSSGNNPCSSLSCRQGEECHVDRQGEARCTCPPPCERIMRPVCGTDHMTYDNECEMKRQACLDRSPVTVSFVGECTANGPCSGYRGCNYGALCVVKNGLPTCECPTCSEEFQPVCGSDGISYTNECKLRAENCEARKAIQVAYSGLCNGCENKHCDHYAICESDGRGGSTCVCPSSCMRVEDPVCGSDGVTYQNECRLRVASCQRQLYVVIASSGACDQCANVKCRFGARCENGICVCPHNCADTIAPVCATDGQTYTNECEMRRQACSQGMELEVEQAGECDETLELSGSGVEICDETTCRFGGTCDFDAEATNGCVCNFNCDAVRLQVCGSDGRTYGNECQLREEQCRRQTEINVVPMDECEDIDEELCDGNEPLVSPLTGRHYNCGNGHETCPAGSYCHRIGSLSKCCQEADPVTTCEETRHGCCPDARTPAPGPNNAGCPSMCQCHPLGSYSQTCDPQTRQCTCKPGVGGRRCDRCDPGYWGLPKIAEGNTGCIPCGCNIFGSTRDDCEQMTGRCVCKHGMVGQKCDRCPNGHELGPQGCVDNVEPIRSCSRLICGYGARCQVNNNNIAECICERSCGSEESPASVCGTDGQTYGSQCQLEQFSCRLQRDIRVAYEGSCSGATSQSTTTELPPRARKTTRHIGNNVKVTREDGEIVPTPNSPKYGLIGDFCFGNEDCTVQDSYCKSGLCHCINGFSATEDNLACTDVDPCSSNPCLNGGDCLIHATLGFRCYCPLGYGGRHCEEDFFTLMSDSPSTDPHDSMVTNEMTFMVPSFAGRSYLAFKKLNRASRDITIEMEFKTLNNDGILFYNGQRETGHGDFISLAVKDGHVEFRFDLGSGAVTLRSPQPVTLNTFHRVMAKRFGQDGMLRLDDGDEVSASSPGTLRSLNLGANLYLGFVPMMTEEIYSNVGVEVGLVGCIESLRHTIKDQPKEYDLIYPGSRDILTGKGISECGQNPCNSIPCQNGATCLKVDDDNFQCNCLPGWVGETCDIDESQSACMPNPCLAGGTCAPLPDGDFACVCSMGRSGETCENGQTDDISVPEFHGNSYMSVPINDAVGQSLAFEVWFLAKKPNGMILYGTQDDTNRGDFISLNMVDRFLQFRYDLGSGIANITSSRKVPLNVWHRVNIARNDRRGTLIVNGGTPVEGQSRGNLNELNLGANLFIGGYTSEYNPSSGITSGLHGAVQKVFENGQLLDNLATRATNLIGVTQYEGAPCSLDDNPCHNNGLCIPQLNEYECKCTPEFGGKHCDQAVEMMDMDQPISFDGRTYHKYLNKISTKQKSQKSNRFEIRFKTTSASGLMLLLHKSSTVQGDYLAIALTNGRVDCSFNLGKQSAEAGLLILSSMERVDDGQWHTLIFNREKRKGTLSIDGGDPVTAVSIQGVTQLDTNGFLWLGGARRLPSGLPQTYDEGFTGCIEYVLIDNEKLDLVENRESHGSVEFCDAEEIP